MCAASRKHYISWVGGCFERSGCSETGSTLIFKHPREVSMLEEQVKMMLNSVLRSS